MNRAIISIFLAAGLYLAAAASGLGQTASVAGEWEGGFNTPGGPRPLSFVLEVDGEKLTGTVKRPTGNVPLTGTIKGDKIEFSYTISYGGNDLGLFFRGTVTGDTMGGIVTIGNTDDEWSAKRVAK